MHVDPQQTDLALFEQMPFEDWSEADLRPCFDYLFKCKYTRTALGSLEMHCISMRGIFSRIPDSWQAAMNSFVREWVPCFAGGKVTAVLRTWQWIWLLLIPELGKPFCSSRFGHKS